MNSLDQMRRHFHQTWDSLAEGWRALMDRAGHALTHFTPLRSPGDLESRSDRVAREAPRWGVLAAELRDDASRIVVRIEAPGMHVEDFDIQVHKDVLVVRGEKHVQREESDGDYFVMECAYGTFERAIPLPAPVDDEHASATYKQGVLRVELPKQPHTRAHRVTVRRS